MTKSRSNRIFSTKQCDQCGRRATNHNSRQRRRCNVNRAAALKAKSIILHQYQQITISMGAEEHKAWEARDHHATIAITRHVIKSGRH